MTEAEWGVMVREAERDAGHMKRLPYSFDKKAKIQQVQGIKASKRRRREERLKEEALSMRKLNE